LIRFTYLFCLTEFLLGNPKIAVFAVRYKENIDTFVRSYYNDPTVQDAEEHGDLSLTIINNFSTLEPNLEYPNVKIINNSARPDFSSGHLARSWNQGILHGFKDLKNPNVDVVLLLQIDACFQKDWYRNVLQIPTSIWYLTIGRGDEFQFIRPEAVRHIGIFDERFCNIGYQESDYFLRAFLGLKDHAVILDHFHKRVHNPFGLSNSIIIDNFFQVKDFLEHRRSEKFHCYSRTVFTHKWGNISPELWNVENMLRIDRSLVNKKEYMYYPYFEMDINPSIYVLR
jgi:hypothetical protein